MSLKTRKILFLALSVMYCGFLLWAILFKMMSPCEGIERLGGIRSINLIPFDFDANPGHHFLEVMFNFLVFTPLGFLLKHADLKWWKVILFGFTLSFVCEITQYILMIGVTDITDLITNTVGTILGVLIFIAIRKLKLSRKI